MKIGFVASSWDLLHAGHISMLSEIRRHCDYLIAALQSDPTIDRPTKNKPIQSMVERYIQLSAVKYVDQIVPYQTEKDLEDILLSYPIDIRFIGEEYRDKDWTGKNICEKRNIEIYFNSRCHNWSSSELRRRIHRIEAQIIN